MVLIVPDCFLVSMKGVSGGQDVVNVIGVRAPGNTALSVCTAALNAWKTAGGPLSKLPTQYSMVEVKAMSLASAEGEVATLGDASPGLLVGPLATNGSCALVTYGAGTRSKSQRGRMYFGPLREADINTDGRTLGSTAAWTSAFTAFRTALQGPNIEWVVISRKNSTYTPIVQIATQNVIGTQRRRIR